MTKERFDPSAATLEAAPIAPLPRISLQAFCETADLAGTLNEAANDRRMERTHVKVNMGGAPAAVEAYRTSPTPNVIVIESSASRGEMLEQLSALAEYCDAGTKVVVIGRHNDIPLYRELMARAVSEYLVQPVGVMEFIAALSQLYNQEVAAPVGRVIAIAGCKGGVGSSCIAHNLAWSIARELDSATVIVDLDMAFGTTGLDFNQDPPQGIAEAVFSPDRLDANLVDRLLSKCSEKLSILAAPATVERVYDLTETAFDPLIEILRGSTPYIVLDIPHVWTAWARRLLSTADETFIVASPELASLRNAKSLLDNLRAARRNDPAPRVVLNGIGMPKRPEITIEDFGKGLELEPAAVLPFNAKLFGGASNNGQMVAEVEDGAKMAAIFDDLARLATGRVAVKRERKGFLEPLLAVLKG
ncbi:AAA family ATPase [Rhodoblastus sp.]|uniref:AAA family ATPase n=1 Tax=Rhodoblastus sp. TaxID=1962975 RepID=UPI0026390930|nr:AAA family ATPase [Rhodoblastus sp.]